MSNKNELRMPPHSTMAERAVLGAIMLMPDLIDSVGMLISATDFYEENNRVIYATLDAMHSRNDIAIDPVTLADELQRAGKLQTAGGVVHIATILEEVPEASHGIYYARIVREKSRARELINACHVAMAAAYEAEDPSDLIDDHALRVSRIQDSDEAEVSTTSDAVDSLIESRRNPRQIHRTGIWQIDNKLKGGMRDGDVIAIGGRPGTGKTVLLSQICQGVIRDGGTALFVSLEMTKEELVDRMSSALPLDEIRDQQILFIDTVFEFERIASLIRTTARQKKIDVVVLDYIQLCEISVGRNETREREIATMSRRLKKLAKSIRCPVVIGSQLNRESVKRGKPTLADLRESGAIEQDASVVILLSKSEDDEETLIDIAKHRGGPTGEVRMLLNGPSFRFDEPQVYGGKL